VNRPLTGWPDRRTDDYGPPAVDTHLHSFVVPAYGETPHLDTCLRSLASQLVPTPVVVSTSTPYDGLDAVCAEHGARLVVHEPNRGIGHDWNAALWAADTTWVTLAHQDDVYEPRYSRAIRDHVTAWPNDLLVFTDYYEIVDGARRPTVAMLRVKKVLLEVGFLGRRRLARRRSKQRVLRLGNPIACPSAALNTRRMTDFRFREGLAANMDWFAWLDIAARDGGIGYVREALLGHRIHRDTETSAAISDGKRYQEDLEAFKTLWPMPVARVLAAAYTRSYRSNTV